MNKIENDFASMSLEGDVLYCTYKVETLDLETAKKVVKMRLDFTKDKEYLILADVSTVKRTDKSAREFFATEGNYKVTANALIVDSPMLKMAANFFISVNKPSSPTKLFTDKKEAIDWLMQFK